MEETVVLNLILTGFLVLLSVQDLRTGTVSLWILCAAAGCGTVLYLFMPVVSLRGLLVLLMLCALPLPAAFCGKRRIGPGDALILPVCVLYLGKAVLAVLLFASFAGAGAAVCFLALKRAKRTDEIRFFPCLLAASVLYGVLLAAGA